MGAGPLSRARSARINNSAALQLSTAMCLGAASRKFVIYAMQQNVRLVVASCLIPSGSLVRSNQGHYVRSIRHQWRAECSRGQRSGSSQTAGKSFGGFILILTNILMSVPHLKVVRIKLLSVFCIISETCTHYKE